MNKKYNIEKPTAIMMINETSKLFGDRMRRETANHGINGRYRPVLMHLSKNEGITQLDLVNMTHLTAPSLSVTLQKMESEGLIRREVDSRDMRQIKLYLTDDGKILDKKLRCIAKEFDALCMSGISEEEVRITKECLKKIIENMLASEREKI